MINRAVGLVGGESKKKFPPKKWWRKKKIPPKKWVKENIL